MFIPVFIIMDVREGNFSEKTLFHKEKKIDEEYYWLKLKLPIVNARFSINSFSMIKEKLGRSEREIGLFIKTRQDSSIRRKVTTKKGGKICHFAWWFIHLFISV